MRITRVAHKGLRRLIDHDDRARIDPQTADKLRKMIGFLQEMGDVDELKAFPLWRAHPLSGDRRGTWSLNVTRNWRLTFTVDEAEGAILDLDLEDYH